MTSTSILRTGALGALLAVTASVGWACGPAGAADPTPVQTFKITPAANATPPIETTVQAEPTATQAAGAVGTSTIAIAGIDSQFDIEEVTAPAGSVTVEFDNRDAGVVHNIHFYKGSDNEGESVAETELEVGPVLQQLTFDAEAGEYYYVCDAHPTTMEGTLTVA